MERFRKLSLSPSGSRPAGGAAVDLSLQFVLADGTDAGTFRLVPRWEPPPPKPLRVTFPVSGNYMVSPPAGPSPPPVGKVFLTMARGGEPVASILLVMSDPKQGPEKLKSREANCYFNVGIDPSDSLATVKFYDINKGSQMDWRSTGVYYLDFIANEDIITQTTRHMFNSVQDLFTNAVHFHGKDSLNISFPPLRMNFKEHFKNDGTIGSGTEGRVLRCLSRFKPHQCAVKVVRPQDFLSPYTGSEPSEVEIFSMLNHNNVAEFFLSWSEQQRGGIFGTGSIFISMKLYDRSLRQYLNAGEFDLENRKYIFRQLMGGIQFMHRCHVAHRDLKPENLMLGDDLTVKIVDFGIAKVIQPPAYRGFVGGTYGRKPYRAPEIVSALERHNHMVDIFSAGMIFYEIFVPEVHGRWDKVEQLSTLIRERTQEFDQLNQEFDLESVLDGTCVLEGWRGYFLVLKRMTNPNANERPSASDVLELLGLYGSGSDKQEFGLLIGLQPDCAH